MTDKELEEGFRKAGQAFGEQMGQLLIECFTTPPPLEASTPAAKAVSAWLRERLGEANASWPPAPIIDLESGWRDWDDPWAGGPYGL